MVIDTARGGDPRKMRDASDTGRSVAGLDVSNSSMNSSAQPAARARSDSAWMLVFVAWLVAGSSTLGALFLGEVMQLPTCVLCWYQRIFMFPLALILPAGLFPFDRNVVRYALPLAGVGWLIAVFHLLLLTGLIPESIQPCAQGVPCSQKVIEWFGFVTIPLLSAAAFSTIIALLVLSISRGPK